MWGQRQQRYAVRIGREPSWPLLGTISAAILLITSGLSFWAGHSGWVSGLLTTDEIPIDCEACTQVCQSCRDARHRVEAAMDLSEMEASARAELQAALHAMGQEVLELERELDLYRSILRPEQGGNELRVQNATFTPGRSDGVFHYRLILTQVGTDQEPREGELVIEVFGLQEGEARRVRFAGDDQEPAIPGFSFQYFQEIRDTLVLPAGFEPEQAVIRLEPGKGEAVETVVKWMEEDKAHVQGQTQETRHAD